MATILAIESSCDETSASICIDGIIINNVIATQDIHKEYGGVVPELASRVHTENIVPVVAKALQGIDINTLDAIAFTQSPGLMGSLLVGCQFAKSMAMALNKPLIAVHHMQAHVLANLIPDNKPDFPFLCLTVSGGHTQIVIAHSPTKLEVIGQTIDDAAGEAFDKTAKLLGLPYPGGPLIDKYAALGDVTKYKFAEPQIPNLDFSFSGLKTSVLYFLQKQEQGFIQDNINDLCASVQHAICTILIKKMQKAIKQTVIRNICLAGGVSANRGLRTAFEELGAKQSCKVFIPAFEYCTDNAAMIAITAYYKYLDNDFVDLSVNPSARSEW